MIRHPRWHCWLELAPRVSAESSALAGYFANGGAMSSQVWPLRWLSCLLVAFAGCTLNPVVEVPGGAKPNEPAASAGCLFEWRERDRDGRWRVRDGGGSPGGGRGCCGQHTAGRWRHRFGWLGWWSGKYRGQQLDCRRYIGLFGGAGGAPGSSGAPVPLVRGFVRFIGNCRQLRRCRGPALVALGLPAQRAVPGVRALPAHRGRAVRREEQAPMIVRSRSVPLCVSRLDLAALFLCAVRGVLCANR